MGKFLIRGFLLAGASFFLLGANAFAQQADTTKAKVSVPTVKSVKCFIKGIVIDSSTMKPVEYATVALTNKQNKPIAVTPTSGKGAFDLIAYKSGDYNLIISSVGYNDIVKPITVSTAGAPINMETIYMRGGIDMETITVSAFKPLVRAEDDKVIYSVETDPDAQTSTALEILRKVPLLTVDGDDEVKLNGQTNYKVLVNGKSSGMMSKNFKDVIKSMPAGTIKDIEVITNPPTKYDSEGIGGIINIITNKKTINGYTGNAYLGVSDYGNPYMGAYVSAQTGKFTYSINGGYNNYRSRPSYGYTEGENTNSITNRAIQSNSENKSVSNGGNLSIEASYDIDTLNLLTLSFWGYLGNSKGDGFMYSKEFSTEGELSRGFDNINSSKNKYSSISGNINYQRSFKKPDRLFTASYNIDVNPTTNENTSLIENGINYSGYSQISSNKANGTEHTFQLDYYDPITKMHQIEGGVKYLLRTNISNSETLRRDNTNDPWVPYNDNNNDLDYYQHIISAYGGYVFKYKKFTGKAGFRVEGTINDGTSKVYASGKENLSFTNKFLNIVPYVNFSLGMKSGQNVSLSYTQRIQRPGIWYLNPFIQDSDPLNISTGNPELEAVVNNSFNASYNKFASKWNLSVGAYASFADNTIEQISTVNDNGVRMTKPENIGTDQNYGLYLSGSIRNGQLYNIYINGSARYRFVKSVAINQENKGFNYSLFAGANVKLWKELYAQANGGYYSPTVGLQGNSSSFYYYSLGLNVKVLDKKLTIGLRTNNPFNKNLISHNYSSGPGFFRNSEYISHRRSFSLNLGYRFGKMDVQVKKTRRSISNDDKMGGGGSGGGDK